MSGRPATTDALRIALGKTPTARRRVAFIALASITIAIGLLVHGSGTMLHPDLRDVLGDALWAAMLMWWVSAVSPGAALPTRTGVALALCFAVELGQLMHTPLLDAMRATTLGRLVLGSGFDARDLVAYTIGVAATCLVEPAVRRVTGASR